MLHGDNEYVRLFRDAFEKAQSIHNDVRLVLRDNKIPGVHKGRTSDEVAGIFLEEVTKGD